MPKKFFLLIVIIFTLIAIPLFTQSRVKVVVSFNAVREIALAMGKDLLDIKTIIPDGTETHDFELKASDLIVLSEARVFIYNGFGMEPWVDKSLKAVKNKSLIVVNASKGIDPIKNTDLDEIKGHGQFDPHVWLSLKGVEQEAKNIMEALKKADPGNKDKYEKNFYDFTHQIVELFYKYRTKFNSVNNKTFVTGHAAFAYLARDFGLTQNSVEDVFAEGEPSAKKLIELIEFCKKNNIKTIFVEDLVSPKVSNVLANEVGAKIVKIYTIESSEDDRDYLQTMEYNLEMIYESLK